jgi:hypothetical protein
MTQEGGEQPSPSAIQFCTNCGAQIGETPRFCSNCGTPLGSLQNLPPSFPTPGAFYHPPKQRSTKETLKEFGRGIAAIGLVLLTLLLIVNVAILIWGSSVVMPIALDPTQGSSLFVIIPWTDPLLVIADLTGVAFALYYLMLIFAITGSFVWLIWKSRVAFKDEISFQPLRNGHSPLYIVGTIFFAVLAFDTIYAILLTLAGVEIVTPDFPNLELWQLLQGLASASVWEELIVRVLYIGAPLLAIDLMSKKMTNPKRYLLGGGFKLGAKELALLWISSGLFAYGHIVSWDAWKIVPAWAAGLAFGYLFLRVGLYASIVLHFTFDYLSMPLDLSSSLLVTLTLGLMLLFWEVLGGVYLLVYIRRMILFTIGADKKPKPQAATPSPYAPQPPYHDASGFPPRPPFVLQPPGPGQVARPDETGLRAPFAKHQPGQGFFSCKYCGWTEARYSDNQLECSRCGKRN